jgi:hypothetical protein
MSESQDNSPQTRFAPEIDIRVDHLFGEGSGSNRRSFDCVDRFAINAAQDDNAGRYA